ncbi:MAG: SMP-30/gluconolactonase/LRE family protein [Ignavibacteriales bacterium]|nr:SMP-30/gluconolactonase/LRE family protein [Ignavibacteriales bacterium]
MNTKILIMFLTIIIFSITISFAQDSLPENHHFIKVADSLKFPEGPAWDGRGSLYVSNCNGNWVTRIRNGKPDTFIVAPSSPFSFEKTNGLTVNKDGCLYACEYGKGAILKFTMDGKCFSLASGYKGKKFNRPNDLAFDSKGNLYFTDPKSYDKNNPDGIVYQISRKTQKVKPVYTGLCFPNGIAISPDAKFVYVCESAKERVLKFRLKKDGTFGEPEVFIILPGGDPDGIAFDVEGNLYVAHFGGKAIYVVKPDGSIKQKIITPGKKPSNLEFADADMKTLYITEDETNAVYKIRVDTAGFRLFCSPNSD